MAQENTSIEYGILLLNTYCEDNNKVIEYKISDNKILIEFDSKYFNSEFFDYIKYAFVTILKGTMTGYETDAHKYFIEFTL